jgi:hypothetical protein
MELRAVLAEPSDLEFAWRLFSSFVRNNLFSGKPGTRERADWNENSEREKFDATWQAVENYIISVDEEHVGWASLSRSENRILIENWHLEPEWRGRKVTETILGELIPKWRADGLIVETQILQGASMTNEAKAVARRLGFNAIGDQDSGADQDIETMRVE